MSELNMPKEPSIKVYETGSGKWVFLNADGAVSYTSDEGQAMKFDAIGLASANGFFEDFLIYRDTMFAVPIGTNEFPWHGKKVSEFIRDNRPTE